MKKEEDRTFLVYKNDGSRNLVYICKNKSDNTFSFVNITKGTISPCKFSSVEDAIKDLKSYKRNRKILDCKRVFKIGLNIESMSM